MYLGSVLQAACLLALSHSIQAQTLAINNVGIIDMTTGRVQRSQNILVEGNIIKSIQTGRINQRVDQSFNASGMVIMPGLTDMHTHLYFTNDASQFAITDNSVFPALLANGVTTVQDLGSNCSAIQNSAQRIQQKQLPGPRIFSTCEMLDGLDSGFATVKRLGDPAQVESEVQNLISQGVNRIKVHLRPTPEVFQAIAESCQRNNILFGGHVPDSIDARIAVEQGMNFFEHMSGLQVNDQALTQEIGRRRLWVTGTLIQRPSQDRLNLANNLRKAGARVLAGTDLPQGPGLCPNGATHQELKLMVQAGFTPLQALQTATTNAYEALGLGTQLGAIEEGMFADMVLLQENPAENINNIDTIAGVVADGTFFPKRTLDRMLRNANVVQNLPFACGGKLAGKPRHVCCSV